MIMYTHKHTIEIKFIYYQNFNNNIICLMLLIMKIFLENEKV